VDNRPAQESWAAWQAGIDESARHVTTIAKERWFTAGAALLAVYLAAALAEGEYGAPAALAASLALIVIGRNTSPRLETWPLVIAVAGYILGNRSFAQISLAGNFPLLPAEAALAGGLVMLAYRSARRQVRVLEPELVNLTIAAWIALGSARIWPDFQRHGFMALRDFAVVYYASFFFLARTLAAHAPSLRLMKRVIVVSLALLPVAFLMLSSQRASLFMPEWGLIFYKDDIVAASLVTGVFLLFTRLEGHPWLQAATLAGLQALLIEIQSSRAAIVGLAAGSVWWCLARRWAYLRTQAIVAAGAVTALAAGSALHGVGGGENRLGEISLRILSIADLPGRIVYEREEQGYLSDNNRFRIVWWMEVAKEVADKAPLTGLGFGHDLSRNFLRAYDQDLGESFSARSPHSIVFTALGRMGVIGLVSFIAIAGSMVLATMRAIRKPGGEGTEALGWWSATWALMVSSCFGVVLEGPMGAVLFWTLLGIAVHESRAKETAAA
jgi:O-Antigen ligase